MAVFQKREDEFRAQTFLQELQAKQQLIGAQYEAAANSYLQLLNQFNLESGMATQLASGVTSVLGANAQTAAKIQTLIQQDTMTGVGGTLEPYITKGIDKVGSILGGLF